MVKIKVGVLLILLSAYSSLAADGDLRLVGSYFSNHGRLEIYYNGVWGTVCDYGFTSIEATVACRQLGYSGYSRYGNVGTLGYSQGTGRIWLDNVNCYSYNTRLSQCSHHGWGITLCYHSEDVALQCTSSNGDLRLVGSSYFNRGRLEVYYNGVWGTVCDDGFTSIEATVACRQLGYSGYSRYGNVGTLGYSQGTGTIWLDNVNCYSYNTRLSDCSHHGWGISLCYHSKDVALQCTSSNGDLRLVGSSYSNRGRLEIYYNGVWGTVCDDGFSSTDARVACRQLGYSTYSRYGNVGRFGYSQGTGRIWLDNVNCYSYSTQLSQCNHLGWGVTRSCYHSEDVALQCSSSTIGLPTSGPVGATIGGSVGGAVGGIIFLAFCIAGCIVLANCCKGSRRAPPPPISLNVVAPSTNSVPTAPPPSCNDVVNQPSDPMYKNVAGPYPPATNPLPSPSAPII